jgi:hypothetical protein
MIEKDLARRIVLDYIKRLNPENDELLLLDGSTLEKPYGWVFFYNSRKYLESGDFRYRLAGNSPILVKRSDGALCELGTAQSVEESLRDYEKRMIE